MVVSCDPDNQGSEATDSAAMPFTLSPSSPQIGQGTAHQLSRGGLRAPTPISAIMASGICSGDG